MLDKYNISKSRIIFISILIIIFVSVVALTVIQAQKQQETRSKASGQDAYNAIEVTDNNGVFIPYKDEESVRTYETKSLDVNIRIKDLGQLGD